MPLDFLFESSLLLIMADQTKGGDIADMDIDPPPSVEITDDSVAMDLDSQPLNDLGVSVMDQDVLERNVAAQADAALSKREDELEQRRLEKAQAKKEYAFRILSLT